MYAASDLYVVASRYEGGPQSVLEAPAMKVPIVSTDVGMARDVLPAECILDDDASYDSYNPTPEDIDLAYRNVKKYFIDTHVRKYDEFFEGLVTS